MQKPSIGRIVHLNWSGNRIPAVVTFVHVDDDADSAKLFVNLQRLAGDLAQETRVNYEEETSESAMLPNTMKTAHRTWSWPPRT